MCKSTQEFAILNTLNKWMRFLGFNPDNGKFGMMAIICAIIYIIILTNLILYISFKCGNTSDKVNAIKSIIFLTVFLIFDFIYILFWNDSVQVLSVLKDGHFKAAFEMSMERKNLLKLCDQTLTDHSNLWLILVSVYLLLVAGVPLVKLLLILWSTDDYKNINIEILPLPYPCYYPRRFKDNLIYYVAAFLLQITITVFAAGSAYVVNVSTTAAMKFLEFELKLLCLSIKEMEYITNALQPKRSKTHKNDTNRLHSRGLRQDEKWQHFIAYFVLHHQDIYQKCISINNGIKFISLDLRTLTSMYLCTSLYVVIQEDDISIQLEELVFCVVWIYDAFLFDVCGERIMTQNENLRDALFDCQWFDKPNWFQRSLLMIMTRTSKIIQIKPFGLYTLNLRNFKIMANAVYSYYNLLRKIK